MTTAAGRRPPARALAKARSGIEGFDQITEGGLPRDRISLVCGGAGCGKTLFAMEFLVRGARDYDEPGVFISFEETDQELVDNVESLGFNAKQLIANKQIVVDHIKVDRREIEETGEYDLEGLFVRIELAINEIGAKRVAIDTLEVLFSGFDNAALLRAELRRLFTWLKGRGVTTVITGERGEGSLTRYGLEEYVSDCVISLDHRVADQISTRRLRVVKYRGSAHGSNEYPFLIDDEGLSVLPVTSLGLDYPVSTERVATGIEALDRMLDGGGYFRGSSVLISGTAGTGKSTLAALFADASCRRKERVLYFALEESNAQLTRNMASIGLDLAQWQAKNLLQIRASRPTVFGLEMHLAQMHKTIEAFKPHAVIIDPISSLMTSGSQYEVQAMLVRLFDFLKMKGITSFVSSLADPASVETTDVGISSLIDTWLQVRDIEIAGERTRGLYLVKSRGMGHSNQVREFVITSKGVDLIPVALGPNGVLTGSARLAEAIGLQQELERRRRRVARKQQVLEQQMAVMRAEIAAEHEDIEAFATESAERGSRLADQRTRGASPSPNGRAKRGARS